MTILYSSISRGATVLCKHQAGTGNFHDVVQSMLSNIPTRADTKVTYTSNNYLFHVIVENGIIFLCATDSDFGRRQPFAYLTEIKRIFQSGSLYSRAQFANSGELDRDFEQVMSSEMDKFSRPENDQMSQLRNQVEEVKGVMTQNIEKVMDRGQRLEDLIDQTNDLEAHSATFRKTSRQVHKKMWWKNTKMTLILVGVGLAVLLIIILIILFSTGVLPGGGSDSSKTTTTPTPP